MRFTHKIPWLTTIRKFPTVARNPPIASIANNSHVFDPELWLSIPEDSILTSSSESPEFQKSSEVAHTAATSSESPESLTSSESTSEAPESSTSSNSSPGAPESKKKALDEAEENRADGHAPIKSALSLLMHSLQKTSTMTTSLSDIDVTLFNFHSTTFAERLLNRNVSSVVMVESSHVFSKNAKKFASQHSNVSAYRADIYTLMGVGRKKTAQFPRKLMFADLRKTDSLTNTNIRPWTLTSPSEGPQNLPKFCRPHLLAVLPTVTIQKTIVDSLIQHALLHHARLDEDTVFRYGDTTLMTFLSSGILSQYECSRDDRLAFLSHQHRRHSALFQKLFDLRILGDPEKPPMGFKASQFHPQLPPCKKVTHEKKLSEIGLHLGLQYPVQISPRNHLEIAGKTVTWENGRGRDLVDFGCFLMQIGRQPNARALELVVRNLWPESSIPADILGEHKIGQLPLDHLESIFEHVHEELRSTQTAKSYCNELKIKRVV